MQYRQYPLTEQIWQNEAKRLARCLQKVADENSQEAMAYREQLAAVRAIIQQVQDKLISPCLVVIE